MIKISFEYKKSLKEKKSSLWTGVIFGLLCIPTLGFSQQLSFEQAYNTMYQNNSLLKAEQQNVQRSQYNFKAIKGLRYPSLTAVGTGIYMDRHLSLDFNGVRDGIAGIIPNLNPDLLGDWDFELNKRGMVMAGLNSTWAMYTGGKINAAVQAEKLQHEIALEQQTQAQNQLISELVVRYYSVKLADKALEVRKEVKTAIEQHQYNAIKLLEHGMIAPVEKLAADVAVAKANTELEAANSDANLARIALANTLEVDGIDQDLPSEFFLVDNLQALSYYQDLATVNFPELKKLALQHKLTQEGVKAKKASQYPTVFAFGQTILAHNNPINGLELLYDNNKPWVVGVGVSYTLFEGLKNRNEIKAAKALEQSVVHMQDRALIDVQTVIAQLYLELGKQVEQLSHLLIEQELAQELVRVRSKAFVEGFASSTDVVDAQTALSVVKLLRLQANFNYTVSLASLLEFCGESQSFIAYTK